MSDRMFAIALDGPAGAGKSTIARQVAAQLGILYLDTGAMYRAMAWQALRHGVDPADEQAVIDLISQTDLQVVLSQGHQQVLINGSDVSQLIRTPEVSKASSDISALPSIRRFLVEKQREIARHRPLILDGRDIGTYVLPQAPWKFFLTASVDERARRRLLDLQARGDHTGTLETVRREIEYRDTQDSNRVMAPLCQAEDACLIDTTDLSIEEVVDVIIKHVGGSKHG